MAEKLPTFDQLMNPLIEALRALGGSGSIQEIYDRVVELERIPERVLAQPHNENSNLTEVGYRLAWARSYLKKFGLLENSKRGVWSLTAKARDLKQVKPQEVVRTVRALGKGAGFDGAQDALDPAPETAGSPAGEKIAGQVAPEEVPQEEAWKQKLNIILTQKLDPAAFERLTQRMLRELGFIHVEVTGRSGDGGIDGRGIARIHGVMSFHVLFQCKRYKGSVGPDALRDFRGAMVGRADKGLFITTGTFTSAAIKEATRDGAPPIDLIDGNEFAEQLKELGLGVKKKTIEVVEVDGSWFEGV